jgi:hypothetical protein
MAPDPARLVADCLSHLATEDASLSATLAALEVVRAAALAGDVDRLEALRGPQEDAARRALQIRSDRDGLRGRIGAFLGVPDADATLDRLAARVGGTAGQSLLAAAVRVRELAVRVDKLNRSNAAVLEQCLGFTRRVLRDLRGEGTPAASYGPDGTPTESAGRPLLSARG